MIGSRAQDRKFFKRFKINYVIYDEGHLLKSCHTERYKNLMKVRVSMAIYIFSISLIFSVYSLNLRRISAI